METPVVEIQYLRLEDDVRERLNRLAWETNRRVSDIANEVLRNWLNGSQEQPEDSQS